MKARLDLYHQLVQIRYELRNVKTGKRIKYVLSIDQGTNLSLPCYTGEWMQKRSVTERWKPMNADPEEWLEVKDQSLLKHLINSLGHLEQNMKCKTVYKVTLFSCGH
jgi:hypothetical protein